MASSELDLTPITGPILLGSLSNCMLFGFMTCQAYLYYLSFPNDRVLIKALVGMLYAIEIAQTAFIIQDIWEHFAKGFGDLQSLNNPQFNWLTIPIMTGIVSCTVQTFFAYRIWILSKSRVVCAVVVTVSLTQLIAALICGAQASRVALFSDIYDATFVSGTVWVVASALCDVIIAISMTICLLRGRESVLEETKVLLSRLVAMSIETGTVTATIATVHIALFLAYPRQVYYGVPADILGKLYTNTFLAILNSRIRIVGGRNTVPSSFNTATLSTDPSSSGDRRRVAFNIRQDVTISTDVLSLGPISADGSDKPPGTQLVLDTVENV